METKEIQNFFSSEKIIQDLAAQLTKDFGLDDFIVNAPIPSPSTFTEFYFQIFPVVEKLHQNLPKKLNLVINRCDISEKQLNRELKKPSGKSYCATLSELIIKRELQKVVIRNMHQKS